MEKRPLVICTDPGIDDFIALSMVLSRPEFDVLGMVALSGNVGLDVTVNNALLACEYNARADIPVLAGSAKPLARPARSASNIHGKSGLGASLELYAKGKPSDKNGADFIIEMARKYTGKLEILSLGPLTDVALALEKAPERFHARLSAVRKTYIYRVWNSDAPCVFERKYVHAEPRPLDLDAMRRAAAQLCGRHEFSAFSTGKKTGRAATRTIESIGIERCGEEVRLTYTGDGFLYNMVRILTGTLLEVGLGERRPDEMKAILASHSRASAGFTAPAQGLFLWDVTY